MPAYRFDGDDLAVGEDFAILALGRRRLQFGSLRQEDTAFLRGIADRRSFSSEDAPPALFDILLAAQLVIPIGADRSARRRMSHWLQLPSRFTSVLATPLVGLTTPVGFLVILASITGLFVSGAARVTSISQLQDWISTVSPISAAVSILTVIVATFVHELGHAAACLRVTGVAGPIRLSTYRGLPAMCADVSSIGRTGPSGKAIVGIAGAACQALFAAAALLAPDTSIRLGASLALVSAIHNAAPLPLTDGYWVLRDLFGISLTPRLSIKGTREGWTDLVYGYGLVIATIAICACLVLLSRRLLGAAGHEMDVSGVRAALLSAASFYSIVVAGIFAVQNGRLYFAGRSPA